MVFYKIFRHSDKVFSAFPSCILNMVFQTHNHFLNILKNSDNFRMLLEFTVFFLANTSFRFSDLMLLLL